MIIIHQISDFLDELFPKYKASNNDLDVLKQELLEFYTFSVYRPQVEISEGFVKITIDTQRIENELQEYQSIVKLCERGEFQKAKPRLESLIKKNPTNSEYHRILGQIYSEEGNQDLAIDTLIEALRWDSKNTYALTMMGNIFSKHKDDIPTAMKYYNQVIEINPKDNIAVNNIGANLMQQGKTEWAKEYFEKALSINPDYPNTHYALALVAEMEHDLQSAFYSATVAMKKSKTKDGLYKQAFNLAVQTAKSIIDTGIGQKIFTEYLHKLEFEGGVKIEAKADESIPTAAKMEFAENYNRDKHIIRFKTEYPAKEHLMMHELGHLQFVIEARKEGVNQLFISTQDHKKQYITSENEWLKKMKKMGISEDAIANVISDLFAGINRQVYNAPIDLFIEDYLYNEFAELRPYQFISLYALIKEGIHAVTDKKIIELSPKTTLYNSKIYNIISGLHLKTLFGVDLLNEFHATQSEVKVAEKMYNEFQEYHDDRMAGEEYELVQHWANDLKLEKYFELIDENEYRNKRSDVESILDKIENDPYDLKSDQSFKQKEMDTFQQSQKEIGTNMAVVMFMVDAMQYFEKLTLDQVRSIAFEIALMGTQGIRPEEKGYKVGLIPHQSFSGHHLLAYYFVSWAQAEPERLDSLRLPYKNEYEMAKTLFKPFK